MNCDFIAPWYRWLEYATFGRALERRRLEYLDEIASAEKVLVLGDGDGRFTAEFLKRNRSAPVDAIDVSAGMARLLAQAVERTGRDAGRVRLTVADARTVELAGSYDVIVTHFFLDCFPEVELERLVIRIRSAACPGARWLVSEFGIPHARFERALGKTVIRALYLGFRMLTGLQTDRLPDYASVFESAGIRCVRERKAAGGLLVSQLWQLPAN